MRVEAGAQLLNKENKCLTSMNETVYMKGDTVNKNYILI